MMISRWWVQAELAGCGKVSAKRRYSLMYSSLNKYISTYMTAESASQRNNPLFPETTQASRQHQEQQNTTILQKEA
jgi:hypothetical protein